MLVVSLFVLYELGRIGFICLKPLYNWYRLRIFQKSGIVILLQILDRVPLNWKVLGARFPLFIPCSNWTTCLLIIIYRHCVCHEMHYQFICNTKLFLGYNRSTPCWHRWELQGNCHDFIVVMVFYLLCQRTKRILVTATTGFKIYILIQSLILFI